MKGRMQDVSSENTKLLERIKSIEALLEAGKMQEAEKDRDLQVVCSFNRGGRRGVGDIAYTIPDLSLLGILFGMPRKGLTLSHAWGR